MTLPLSTSTRELLEAVEALSANTLKRRNDLGILIGLAERNDARHTLDDLAFSAKFVVNVHGIMKRIGPGGEGYDKLGAEFSVHIEKATGLTGSLLASAPSSVQEQFAEAYFALTPAGLQNLLALFHDLAWYKNWLIDHTRP